MQLDAATGLLDDARYLASPNHDERPAGCAIELLVVHGISLPPGQFGGPFIDQLFTNSLDPGQHPYFRQLEGLRVSSHVLIRRDGSVTQYVPFLRRAWHAGASSFDGRTACNDFAIGIELEGCDDQPYEAVQYDVLAQIARAAMAAWPAITPQRIVGHADIAPGRKTDPGPLFDWALFRGLL